MKMLVKYFTPPVGGKKSMSLGSVSRFLMLLLVCLATNVAWAQTTYYNLQTATETIMLNQAALQSYSYLGYNDASGCWTPDAKDYGNGKYTGVYYQLSNNQREIRINVQNVTRFEVLVQNSTSGRQYILNGETITHTGVNVESSGKKTTGTTGQTTITLKGSGKAVNGSATVYPVAIKLYRDITASFNDGLAESIAGFFDVSTSDGSNPYNTKYTGVYGGITYKKGLKIDTKATVSFTTTESAEITIVQSTSANGDNPINLDGSELNISDGTTPDGTTTCRVYKLNIPAGTHTITRGSVEFGLLYIEIVYNGKTYVLPDITYSVVNDADSGDEGITFDEKSRTYTIEDVHKMLLVRLTPENYKGQTYEDWKNSGYTIYYTTDGTNPTTSKTATLYEGSLRVISPMVLTASLQYMGTWGEENPLSYTFKFTGFNENNIKVIEDGDGRLDAGEAHSISKNGSTLITLTYGSPGDYKVKKDGDNVVMENGKPAKDSEIWEAPDHESASVMHYSQIAGFEWYAKGNKDAEGEHKWDYEAGKYSDYRYKYDGEKDNEKLNTFDIPMAGNYYKFEPEVDGTVSIVVRQTGIISEQESTDVTSDLSKVVKRYAFVCDETGNSLEAVDRDPVHGQFTAKISSKALLENRVFAFGREGDLAEEYPVKDEGLTLVKEQSQDKLFDYQVELYKYLWDNDIEIDNTTFRAKYPQYPAEYNTDEDINKEVKIEKKYTNGITEKHYDRTVNGAANITNFWNECRGKYVEYRNKYNDNSPEGIYAVSVGECPLPNVLAHDTYGFYVIGKAYVMYTFPVKAGKTYFLTGRWTKLAPCGYMFEETGNGDEIVATIDANATTGSGTLTTNTDVSKTHKVTLNRKFTANVWTSLVLPFTMSPLTVQEIFGDETEVVHFNRVEREKGTGDENPKNVLYLTKHYHQMIVAGTPVFIRPTLKWGTTTKETINTFTVSSPYDPDESKIWQMDGKSAKGGSGWHIEGSYTPTTIPVGSYIMGYNPTSKENSLQHIAEQGMPIAGTRAWIRHSDNAEAKLASFGINGVEDTTTTIEELFFGEETPTVKGKQLNGVYNMNGQQVRMGTTDTTGLPAGIYIAGGKKVVVK